nr:endonuclease/exonuclease/phosphatase family protein [Myxococcales bacterium]
VRSGPTITLLSANLYAPNREPAALVGEIGSVDADVVVLQELTRRWRRELQPVVGGLHEHSVVRDDAFGIGVFSKHPLLASDTTTTWDLPALRVELQPPGGERLAIYVVHTLPPATRHGAQVRREQLERLREQLESERLPFVVLGDLNLTVHDPLWGHLVREPVVDAMDSCGRWWGPTWPNGVVPLPPLRLDHALHSRGLLCVSLSEGVGEGSDHRPVQVVLRR